MIRQTYRHRDRHVAVELQRAGEDRFLATVDGRERAVQLCLVDGSTVHLIVDGQTYAARVIRTADTCHIALNGEVYVLTPEAAGSEAGHTTLASPEIVAPMPGKVLEVLVREGQEVGLGDGLLILEAMKMENRIVAEAPAVVRRVHVEAGQMVDGGTLLLELEYSEPEATAEP